MIFVDTSAWYASLVAKDKNHHTSKDWSNTNSELLVSTDYIVGELITLLIRRRERARLPAVRTLSEGPGCAHIEFVTGEDFFRAWKVQETYRDKGWSFTDCTSKVVMERLGITQAVAFDDHFRQFGTVTVLP